MMSIGTEWTAMTGRRRLCVASVTNRAATWNSPVDIYRVGRTRMKEKNDLAILKDFFSLSFFAFPPL